MHTFLPGVITHNATFQEDLYYFSNLINLRHRKLSYVPIEKGFSLYIFIGCEFCKYSI